MISGLARISYIIYEAYHNKIESSKTWMVEGRAIAKEFEFKSCDGKIYYVFCGSRPKSKLAIPFNMFINDEGGY